MLLETGKINSVKMLCLDPGFSFQSMHLVVICFSTSGKTS